MPLNLVLHSQTPVKSSLLHILCFAFDVSKEKVYFIKVPNNSDEQYLAIAYWPTLRILKRFYFATAWLRIFILWLSKLNTFIGINFTQKKLTTQIKKILKNDNRIISPFLLSLLTQIQNPIFCGYFAQQGTLRRPPVWGVLRSLPSTHQPFHVDVGTR